MNGDTATITIFAIAAVPVLGLIAYGGYHLVLGAAPRISLWVLAPLATAAVTINVVAWWNRRT